MPKITNAEPGISLRPDGKYRVRLTFRNKNYETVARTKFLAREWRTEMLSNLPKCPEGISYEYGSWCATVEIGAGCVSEKFKNYDSALAWQEKVIRDVALGAYSANEMSTWTLREYTEHWVEGRNRATERTVMRYRTIIRNQIEPQIGNLTLNAVTPTILKSWVKNLEEVRFSADTIGKAISLVRAIFKTAVDEELIPRNPALCLEKPRTVKARREALTLDELMALATNSGRFETMCLVMGLMGLRLGEVRALQIHDINFFSKKLQVSRALTIDSKHRTIVGATKTKQVREIRIPEPLLEKLSALVAGRDGDDWLFKGARGGAVSDGWFRKSIFKPAAKRSGLGNVTPHNLRHTAASLLISQGTSITTVAHVLGHSTPALTLSTYAHFYDKDVSEAMDKIGESFVTANIGGLRESA